MTSFKINAAKFGDGGLTIEQALRSVEPQQWGNIKHLVLYGADHQHDFLDGFGKDKKNELFPKICERAINLKVVAGDVAFIDLMDDMPERCRFWAYYCDSATVVSGWKELFHQTGLEA